MNLFDGAVLVVVPTLDGHTVIGAENVNQKVVAAAAEPEVFAGDAGAKMDFVAVALTLGIGFKRVPSVCAIEEDGVLASFAEDKRIVAGTTTEDVLATAAVEKIVASTAVEGVVASTASDSVGNAGADESVVGVSTFMSKPRAKIRTGLGGPIAEGKGLNDALPRASFGSKPSR